jgi:hypothetical protein
MMPLLLHQSLKPALPFPAPLLKHSNKWLTSETLKVKGSLKVQVLQIQLRCDVGNNAVSRTPYTVDPRKSNGLILEQLEPRTKYSRKIRFKTRIKIRKSNHERGIAQHRSAYAI